MSLWQRLQRWMYRKGWGEYPEETDLLADVRDDIHFIRAGASGNWTRDMLLGERESRRRG